MDLLAATLLAVQGANWQRSGGDEDKRPTLLTRPSEDGDVGQPVEDEGLVPLNDIDDVLAERRRLLRADV